MLNILSLDVAFGAAISSYFFSRVFSVALDVPTLICLGLTVWLIYTTDHLTDAKSIKHRASTLRHQFHQRHFKVIAAIVFIVLALIIALLFFVPSSIIFWGLCLSALVFIYLIIQRKLGAIKEVLGAILYTIGVMIPIIALSDQSLYSLTSIPSILFFNTALINLILFSWFDVENDLADKQPSLATIIGHNATVGLLTILFAIQFSLLVYAYLADYYSNAIAVFTLMFVILFAVFLKAGWFAAADKYRLTGDAVFLIPLLHVLL
jgi:4-hydroxybenzoate polyprenyltransferase